MIAQRMDSALTLKIIIKYAAIKRIALHQIEAEKIGALAHNATKKANVNPRTVQTKYVSRIKKVANAQVKMTVLFLMGNSDTAFMADAALTAAVMKIQLCQKGDAKESDAKRMNIVKVLL